jgi:hypothetical protein
MKTEKTVSIGGQDYTIHQFGATEGLKLGLELSKRVAPVVAPLVALGQDRDITVEMAEKVADALVQNLDVDTTVGLIQRLVSKTTVTGVGVLSGVTFETHFAGNYAALLQVLREVVSFNFADFFSGLGALMPGRPEKTAE